MSIPSEEAIAFTAKCSSSALQPEDHRHINNTSITAPQQDQKSAARSVSAAEYEYVALGVH